MATDVNFGLQQYSAFSPPSIGACLLWLDAADSNTITGSPVTQWRDKSGRGSNATTGLGSVTAGTAINTLNTLRFGFNQTLNLSNFQTFSTNNSIFYVIRGVTSNTSGGGTGYFVFSRTVDNFSVFSGNQQFDVYQNPGAGRSYVTVMGSGGERNWGNLSTTAFSSTSNIVTTAGISYASVNGTSQALVATAVVRNTVATASTYQISTSRNCCGDVFTYDLGELIVYDGTLSLGEIQQVEGYLARKWGFTLPVGHPYRGVPPAMRLFQTVDILAMSPHLWFDAADSTTITGSPTVTQWSDKSGRGCNATTGLGSVTLGTAINSSNTLRFGLNQTLNISNLTMTNTNTSVVAIFRGVTSNANPAAGTGYFLFSRPADNFLVYTGNQQFACYQNPASGISYAFVMGPSTERNWGQLSTTAFANRVNIVSISGSNSADISGTSLVTNQSNAVVSNTVFTSTTYQISTSRNCCGDVFTYDLGELIVFDDAISTGRSHQLQAYLARKWGQTLTSGNFFSRNPVLVPLFVPTTLTGLALWLDGADSSTLTLSGSSVTAWSDKSGNSRNATGGVSPTLGTNGVTFNGTTQYLSTTYSAVPAAESVFVVATWTGTTDRNYCIIGTSATNGRGYNVFRSGGAAVIRWDRWGVAGYAQTSGVQSNVQFMSSAIFTGSAGTTGLNGGSQSASAAFSFSGTGTTNIGTGVLSDYFTGTINEVLCFSRALSTPQRQRVEGYLAWKWGLSASLPTTHPFSKFRP